MTLPKHPLRRLKANSRLMGVLRSSLERLTAGKDSSCDDWLRDGEWETSCHADISRAVDGLWPFLDNDAQTVKRDIEFLKGSRPTEPPPMLEMTEDPELQQVSTLLTLGQVSVPAAIGRLNKIDSSNNVLHKDLDDLRAELERLGKIEMPLSGDTDFTVGILNSGDTDGVIYPSGELHFKGAVFPVMARDQKYTVVKSHSFEQTIFDVFPGDDAKGFNAWTAAVRSKDPVEFEISLKLSGGKRPLRYKGTITK